ncbi:hypothetical protein KFU94_50115 [Chloroflexi bacterium TSY]|nr:hypothetical protein [Chloroflexi bacterium TSY]
MIQHILRIKRCDIYIRTIFTLTLLVSLLNASIPKITTASSEPNHPIRTKVITDEAAHSLAQLLEDGTLIFDQTKSIARKNDSNVLSTITVGDILVSDVTDIAPHGFLRKVTAVEERAGQKVFQTVPANLAEAIGTGTLDTGTVVLTPNDLERVTDAEGNEVAASMVQDTFSIELDNEIFSQVGGGRAVVNGTVSFSPSFTFYADFSGFRLIDLDFSNRTTVEADIDVTVESPILNLSAKKVLQRHKFKTFRVWVAGVPVVLTPELTLYLGLDGTVSAEITAGVRQSAILEAGLLYQRGDGWGVVREVDFLEQEVDLERPTPDYALNVSGGPKLSLAIYGVRGPYAEILGCLRLEVEPDEAIWWKLYGGFVLQMGVEVMVRIWGYEYEVVDYHYPLIERKWLLPEADGSTPPSTSTPTPASIETATPPNTPTDRPTSQAIQTQIPTSTSTLPPTPTNRPTSTATPTLTPTVRSLANPQILQPEPNAEMDTDDEITLVWRKVEGAEQYVAELRGSIQKESGKLKSNRWSIGRLPAGQYTLSIGAYASNAQSSQTQRELMVEEGNRTISLPLVVR